MNVAAPLITRYRPERWDQVVGHDSEIDALQRAMASDSHPHSYLLTGIKGTGKTTIARLIGQELEAEVIEVVGSVSSGVEDMRELVNTAMHASLHGNGNRLFLIDECHRLSRNAWDALLAVLEEPPAHAYFALCTTEAHRLPETVVSRCYGIKLQPLSNNHLDELLEVIAELEGWSVRDDVLSAVVQAARGSARMGITLLQRAHSATGREEVERTLEQEEAKEPVKQLMQFILKGGKSWVRAKPLLSAIDAQDDYTEALTTSRRYISGALVFSTDESEAKRIWTILEMMTAPMDGFDPKVAFITIVGRLIWG